jgi:hypothetical protein
VRVFNPLACEYGEYALQQVLLDGAEQPLPESGPARIPRAAVAALDPAAEHEITILLCAQ